MEATLHTWDALKDIKKWSDGRLRIVVTCNKCGDAGSGSTNAAGGVGWKSCVGHNLPVEDISHPTTTHRITLKTSTGFRSKCLLHLIKLHKKLVEESNSLPSSSGSQFGK